jgi:hypothetical protein
MTVDPTFCNNPYGGGKQIIIDVAITGIDVTTSDDKPDQPLDVRTKQKEQKYGEIADRNDLAFVAAILSRTGQGHRDIRYLFLEQIRLKQLVDGEVKTTNVQAIMKHSVRIISAAVNRSASINILLKATRMVNLARHTQQNFSSSSSCDLTSSPSRRTYFKSLYYNSRTKTLSKS